MPQLTEENLAAIYPTAKTYDELRAERKQLQEQRRPKHVAPKIACFTSFSVPVVTVAYFIIQRVASTMLSTSGGPGASMAVLTGVCFLILAGIVGLGVLYYLWWLIDGLASKVFVNTPLLYLFLGGVLCVAGAAGGTLHMLGYPTITTTPILTVGVFMTSYLVAKKAESLTGHKA